MACGAGGVAPTGATEVYTGSAHALPTIRVVAADLAARADFDLDPLMTCGWRWTMRGPCCPRIAAPDAAHKPMLRCRFTVWPERIEVATEVDVDDVADLLSSGRWAGGSSSASQTRSRPLSCPGNLVSLAGCASSWSNAP